MRAVLWLLVAAWLFVALVLGVLHGAIVPRIGEIRPLLERQASRAIGVPVRIGGITANTSGLFPSFELADVALLDSDGQVALRLPRLLASLSVSSLWRLGFDQLLIDRPELDIRRTADGAILIAGLLLPQQRTGESSAAADWLLSQPEVVLRGGRLRWTDEMRQAPPLTLTDVEGTLRSSGRRHALRLDATPPPQSGERFGLRGQFSRPLLSHRESDFSQWSGQMYAEFGRTELMSLARYLPLDTWGMALSGGTGALRAWADVRSGEVTGGSVDVALRRLQVRLGRELTPLGFATFAGRLSGERRANGFDVATEGLSFLTSDGLLWPGGNVALSHVHADEAQPEQTSLKADRLDLATLGQIAGRLPVGARTHTLLRSFAPQGVIDTVRASWRGPLEAPVAYSAAGRVRGLQLASAPLAAVPGVSTAASPGPGRPGISGATLDFELNEQGGKSRVSITDGAIDLPGVFDEARVPFDQLSVNASWKTARGGIELQLRDLLFANADLQGEAQLGWRRDAMPGGPAESAPAADRRALGTLDLQGSLKRGNGARVHRYLPSVLPLPARQYVQQAVVAGALSDVKFRVRGGVADIPFAKAASGDFRVSAKVAGAHFDYVPASLQPAGSVPWPALTELAGELAFTRAALSVQVASGRVAGFPGLQLLKGDATVADLTQAATVDVQTALRGPLADALAFVNRSPVGGLIGEALAQTTASGMADYRVRLSLPIADLSRSRVEGSVSLPGNDVEFVTGAPQLAGLKGLVNFTDHGFTVSGAQARLFGGELRFDGGMRPPAAGSLDEAEIAFKAQGTMTADGLRRSGHAAAARLGQRVSGTTGYSATLGFKRGVAEVALSSSLVGLALDFPTPLTKPAETSLPLQFEMALLPESLKPGQRLQDQISLNLGKVAAVRYVRELGGAQPRVLRGGIGVGAEAGDAAPVGDTQVVANINLPQVDLDAWERVFSDTATALPAGAAPAPSPATTVPAQAAAVRAAPAASSAASGYLPSVFAIRANELTVQGRQFKSVVVGGSRVGTTWRANIDSTELNGYAEFRPASGVNAGQVYARLARLRLAPGRASEVEALLNEQPATIPALDIVVDDLELTGRKLGFVEIAAVNSAGGPASAAPREWRLSKLNVIVPEAVFTATGSWAAASAGSSASRRTTMDFTLDIADSGELLKRFGMAGVIRGGKGRLEGEVAWSGSPLGLDYPSLAGQLNVNVASGQFIKADPGIARLLGVLSLQSLPRRLTLDFRDVFSDGFAFDFVRGDVSIDQGIAQTNNLQMSGVNAAVLMEGRADIARETQDIRVVVVPEINAGTASLIATVINPAVGLGTFLAQIFLRRPLMEAATQEFHIDGTWTDPKITKVNRRLRGEQRAGEVEEGQAKP